MAHTLPQLPYAYDALEPFIDTQTMTIHHTKHHQTYVDKLNAALAGNTSLENMPVDDLLRQIQTVPEDIKVAVKNHGGGHSNHSIFWTLLAPSSQTPSENINTILTQSFGSFDGFKEKFSTAAANHFGSGWVWLIKNAQSFYEIKAFANQDSPYMENATPILGIDVWEHAYYLKYQNKRADYINAFFSVINWSEVEKRLS